MEYSCVQKRRHFIVSLIFIVSLVFSFKSIYAGNIRIVYPRFGINAIRHSNDTLTIRFNLPPDSLRIIGSKFKSKWYRNNDSTNILLHLKGYKEGIYSILYTRASVKRLEKHAIVVKNHHNFKKFLRLIFITDTHIGYRHTTEKLKKWVKIINTQHPDIVVFGGDNIEYQNSQYMKTFMNLANMIQAPLFIIPGNHEHHNIFKFPMNDILFKRYIEGFDHFHESVYPISLYLMDSRNDDLPIPSRCKGPLKSSILWADSLLKSDTMPFKILVMHGPPRDPVEHNQDNNDLLMSIAKKDHVNFILCGHTHVNAIYDNNTKKYDKIEKSHEPLVVETGTACKTFLPLADIREMDFYFKNDSLYDRLIYLKKR